MQVTPKQVIADARHIAWQNSLAIVERGQAWIVYRRVPGATIRLGRRSDPARLLSYIKRLSCGKPAASLI